MRGRRSRQELVEQFGLALGGEREVVFDRVGDAAQEVPKRTGISRREGQQLDPERERARDTRQ
jgi:hypothetical protein